MRRVLLVVLFGTAAVALLTSAAGATAASGAFKTGTYDMKPSGSKVTLKRAQCAGKLQFCVALPKSPAIVCLGGPSETLDISDFTTPVALPSSGKLTEHTTFTEDLLGPGAPPATGQSAFSIAFKKNGTASGYVEVSLTYPLLSNETTPEKCSGKMAFTAKLA
jgi:hypothetical protein